LPRLSLSRQINGTVVTAEENHLRGQTGWFVRLLTLFSYMRSVEVDRNRRRIAIRTVWLWVLGSERILGFDQVRRIVCQVQQNLPSDSALFFISLALADGSDLPLFTVWEQQPRERDWLDELAGQPRDDLRVGDEASVSIIDLLREYLGVPIARH
jgi:hypothetical protein